MENEFPKRKTVRLDRYDYSKSGAYFLTMCTKDRKPILSIIPVGDGALCQEQDCKQLCKRIVYTFSISFNAFGRQTERSEVRLPKARGAHFRREILLLRSCSVARSISAIL